MDKLLTYLKRLDDKMCDLFVKFLGHKAVYAGLAGCHGAGIWLTDKPVLYALMAAFYTVQFIQD